MEIILFLLGVCAIIGIFVFEWKGRTLSFFVLALVIVGSVYYALYLEPQVINKETRLTDRVQLDGGGNSRELVLSKVSPVTMTTLRKFLSLSTHTVIYIPIDQKE